MMPIHDVTLSIGVVFALFLIWRWQRTHPHFDLSDLVTGDNGRVSASKFIQLGAWVLASWGFVTLLQQGKLTEWYFAAYMTVSMGSRVLKEMGTQNQTPPTPTP